MVQREFKWVCFDVEDHSSIVHAFYAPFRPSLGDIIDVPDTDCEYLVTHIVITRFNNAFVFQVYVREFKLNTQAPKGFRR